MYYNNDLDLIDIEQSMFESSIIDSYNEIMNESYVTEAEEKKEMVNAKATTYSFDKKAKYLDRIKLMNAKDKKFLSKYKDKALNANTTGLTLDNYHEFNCKEITSYLEKVSKRLENMLSEYQKLSDEDKKEYMEKHPLKDMQKEVDSEYAKLVNKAFANKKQLTVTPDEVKKAVKTLENIDKELTSAVNKLTSEQMFLTKKDKEGKDSYAKKITSYIIGTRMSINDLEYKQVWRKQMNARQIILLASKHKPRNIKESVDFGLYNIYDEMFEYEIELDELNY